MEPCLDAYYHLLLLCTIEFFCAYWRIAASDTLRIPTPDNRDSPSPAGIGLPVAQTRILYVDAGAAHLSGYLWSPIPLRAQCCQSRRVCRRPSKGPSAGSPGFLIGGQDRAVAPEVALYRLREHGPYGPIMPLLVSANEELFTIQSEEVVVRFFAGLPPTSQGRSLLSNLLPTRGYRIVCAITRTKPVFLSAGQAPGYPRKQAGESVEK